LTTVWLVELPVEQRRLWLLEQLRNESPRTGKLLVKSGLVADPAPEAVAAAAERIAVFRIEMDGRSAQILCWRGRASPIHARILYMATLPLAEVRANLSKLVDEAVRTHERIEVTRQGRRAVVILSADDYDSIMETLAILSDQGLMRELQAAEAEVEAGQMYTLDEVTEEMRAAGRLPQ
jgi:antitoxin YefM